MKKSVPFRPSSLEERRKFYDTEFSLNRVKSWFKQNKVLLPQLCAIDAGTESGIILHKSWKNIMFYFPFSQLKQKIRKYLPEDVYYDRNTYENPKKVLNEKKRSKWIKQELAFDIDVDNLNCKHNKKEEVCNVCILKAHELAIKLKSQLKKLGFKKISIDYSGRGFHVHVFDKTAYNLSIKDRDSLNKKFKRFAIDPWVSRGHIGLMRLPYTLHGLVSRKVTPINKKFNAEKTIPKFLTERVN